MGPAAAAPDDAAQPILVRLQRRQGAALGMPARSSSRWVSKNWKVRLSRDARVGRARCLHPYGLVVCLLLSIHYRKYFSYVLTSE